MKFSPSVRPRLLSLLLVGVCGFELVAATGCVVYPSGGGAVVAGPPVVNVGYYGNPTGYYYRNYPVYVYKGRHCYYSGGHRYWYGGGHRYYYRSGYRHYY